MTAPWRRHRSNRVRLTGSESWEFPRIAGKGRGTGVPGVTEATSRRIGGAEEDRTRVRSSPQPSFKYMILQGLVCADRRSVR